VFVVRGLILYEYTESERGWTFGPRSIGWLVGWLVGGTQVLRLEYTGCWALFDSPKLMTALTLTTGKRA